MNKQAKILAYIEEAMDVLEARYQRQPSTLEVQAYLYAEHHKVASLESIKRNGDIVLEFRRKELPRFHEHEQDSMIPPGYGIDESHDGGFYPYRIVPGNIFYLPDDTGLDKRFTSYADALLYIQERASC